MRRSLLLSFVSLAFCVPLAGAVPPGLPPKQGTRPPPAWLEKPGTDRWLAYSTYCWTTGNVGMCADYVSPKLRTDLPRIHVARRTTVRFHLGFRPTSLSLQRIDGPSWRLARSRVASWSAAGPGVYLLAAYVTGGDASYAFRIV